MIQKRMDIEDGWNVVLDLIPRMESLIRAL